MQVVIRMDSNHIKNKGFPVELAFVDVQEFLKLNSGDYLAELERAKIQVVSIHSPHFKILDPEIRAIFFKLRYLATKLNAKTIVAHPSYGNLKNKEVLKNLAIINNMTGGYARVCIEKFTSRRRIISSREDYTLMRTLFPNLYCCYDFSHVPRGNEETIIDYLPITPVIHVSNRKGDNIQHQRLFDTSCNLDYDKIVNILKQNNWSGELVIEYLEKFHSYVEQDAKRLEKIIYGDKK